MHDQFETGEIKIKNKGAASLTNECSFLLTAQENESLFEYACLSKRQKSLFIY